MWSWNRFAPYFPRVELRRFKNIDFFPSSPPDLKNVESICIGSKTRTIGDPLQLSTLPSKLKTLHPHLKIYTYPRGFNPVVFAGNPYVSGMQWLPDQVYGDDCNQGRGHLIERKERFFGITPSGPVRPEIYLMDNERAWIDRHLGKRSSSAPLPICIIHPWGKTRTSVLGESFWSELIQKLDDRLRFWQVGIEGQTAVPNCEKRFLLPKGYHHARKLFAVLSRADFFMGVDSGPMHVARAFDIPSLIFTDMGISAQQIFDERSRVEGAANASWNRYFLYAENRHFDVLGKSAEACFRSVEDFLKNHS